jgi:hypothetical protein
LPAPAPVAAAVASLSAPVEIEPPREAIAPAAPPAVVEAASATVAPAKAPVGATGKVKARVPSSRKKGHDFGF